MRCPMGWPSFRRGVWRVSGTQVESSSVKHVRSICVRSIRVRSISSAVYAGARARTHFEQDVSEFINIFFERIEETMQDKVCCAPLDARVCLRALAYTIAYWPCAPGPALALRVSRRGAQGQ